MIFVKHPLRGQVKTRLAAGIGEEKALIAYQRLLKYTLDVVKPLRCDKVVFYGNQIPERDLWSKAGHKRKMQQGADLGQRMKHAFEWGFKQGYKKIIIIGSDNAKLSTSILEHAFALLDEKDAVIGPAADGGYYCLGIRELIVDLFENKKWSTSTVYDSTINDFKVHGKTFGVLETLSDIDNKNDLKGTFLADLL